MGVAIVLTPTLLLAGAGDLMGDLGVVGEVAVAELDLAKVQP